MTRLAPQVLAPIADPSYAGPRVGYVVKMYPRFSETFIVSEILAHEEAGLPLEIFSLRAPVDTHFQDAISRVRSPVNYVPAETPKPAVFWDTLREAGHRLPGFWARLGEFSAEPVRDVYQAAVLAITIDEKSITHLHAHFASVAASVARMASRLAGIRFSVTAHAKDIFHDSVNTVELRQNLLDASAVVTVSDFNVRYLRDHHGHAAARVQRIYNGLDLEEFLFTQPAFRGALILGVGRLVEKKGFDDLITACAILRDRNVNVHCSIVGAGELGPMLRSHAEALRVTDRVEFAGPLPRGEVIERIRRASIVVAPCVDASDGNRDGLPTVILEAMALGTPCVSTNVTGIPEVLIDGKTGLMAPQRDPPRLAECIQKLLEDQSLRIRLAENARELVEENFDIRRNTARLRELFARGEQTSAEAA